MRSSTTAALLAALSLAASTPADACQCGEGAGQWIVGPTDGATIPRNAHFWLAYDGTGRSESELDASVSVSVGDGELPGKFIIHGLWQDEFVEFVPDDLLDAGAIVTFRFDGLQSVVTVGDATDAAPPTWSGDFDIESRILSTSGSCGWVGSHRFAFPDAQDDQTDPSQLFWRLEPLSVGHEVISIGAGNVNWTGICGGNDDTLEEKFHRGYRATPVDLAGNTGKTRVIRTYSGCCAPPPPEVGGEMPLTPATDTGAWIFMVPLSGFLRRRRR